MPRLKTEETLLGTSRAAKYLEICRSTLTYWRRKGELKPTATEDGPCGKRFKFSLADLDRFRERIDYDG